MALGLFEISLFAPAGSTKTIPDVKINWLSPNGGINSNTISRRDFAGRYAFGSQRFTRMREHFVVRITCVVLVMLCFCCYSNARQKGNTDFSLHMARSPHRVPLVLVGSPNLIILDIKFERHHINSQMCP